MPKARAERATAPRFSGSLSPSRTPSVRAPATTSSSVGSGRRSAAATAPRCRSNPTVAASTALVATYTGASTSSSAPSKRARACGVSEDRADVVPRRQQALDRRDALGDEQLVALDAAPDRGVGQGDVVGEAGIGGVVDRHLHPASLTALDATAATARASNTCPRTCVPRGRGMLADMHLQGSLFGATEPAVDASFAGLRRIELDDRSWLDHLPGWLAGEQAVFDHLISALPWRQRTVTMWERRLPEPRLTSWWTPQQGAEAMPILATMRRVLSDPLRRGVRLDRVQLLPPRRGLRRLARRPPPPHDRRSRRRHRQRRRAPTVAHPTTRRRAGARRSTSAAATCS